MNKSKEERNSSGGMVSSAAGEDNLQDGAVENETEELGKRQTVKGFVNHITKHGSILSSQRTDGRG